MNIIDYVKSEKRTFSEHPFNDVDSLVLSKLSYIRIRCLPYQDLTPSDFCIKDLLLAENFDTYYYNLFEENVQLLYGLCASPRFRNLKVFAHRDNMDKVAEKQFSATCFLLPDDTIYVAYRGTDSTLVGWKEDFNMAYISPVPSQEEGVIYLENVANANKDKKLILGGHSKGGNIALYSGAFCSDSTFERITTIYDHDGPGFNENVLSTDKYKRARAKTQKSVPEASLVGMLLSLDDDVKIIECDGFWAAQHEPYKWHIDENGSFITKEKLDSSAYSFSVALDTWLKSATTEQRECLVDTLFDVLGATEVESFAELSAVWTKKISNISSSIGNIDDETKHFLNQTISSLVGSYIKNLIPKSKKES